MKYTIFDRLGCMPEIALFLQEMGMEVVYPRVVLVGEKRCGKSALLRLVTGYDVMHGPIPYSVYMENTKVVNGNREGTLPTSWSQVHVAEVPYDLNLVRKYIEPKSSVIVVVISANEDLPRDLLSLVAEIDPACERTVGVLTHIDTKLPKEIASHLLSNDLEIPFKLIGFSSGTNWFEGHAFFSNLPLGFAGLATVIEHIGQLSSRVFSNHVRHM